MDTLEDQIKRVEILRDAVRLGGHDLAPNYYEYLRLAFGLANDLGEAGRSLFHDFCRVNPKYTYDMAEKHYNGCMRRGATGHPCTLGTVFELAKRAGVDMDAVNEEIRRDWVERHKDEKSFSINHNNNQNQPLNSLNSTQVLLTPASVTAKGVETGEGEGEDDTNKVKVEGSEPPSPLPTFPAYDFPFPFKEAMAYGRSDAERDAIFLSVATVLGATLNWTVRVSYGHAYRYPQMQTFVLAQAGSGKSVIDYAREFAMPLHRKLRAETEHAMREYRRAMQEYKQAMRKSQDDGTLLEEPQIPKNKMFLIPANNSASGMIQCLIDSEGNGLIQESEADTLTIIMKSDFGNWSDVMRKTYDHGWISFNRRTDREFMEIQHTRLAVLIAGTPSQLAPLIPSADNGLFSRQNFYYMPANNTWENQVDLEDNGTISDDFARLADRWEEIRRNIAFHGVHRLVLTKEQKQRFNDMMKGLMDQVVGIGDDELRASVQRTKRFERDEFIAQLPDEFRLSDVKKLAESLGVNFRTSQTWVRRMVKANLLSHDPETKIYTQKRAESLNH